jgi:hypothetical protein
MGLKDIAADVVGLAPTLSSLMAAYNTYKAIWTAINPGKTDADYEQHLLDLSNSAISAADAILIRDGYVQALDGSWSKPK